MTKKLFQLALICVLLFPAIGCNGPSDQAVTSITTMATNTTNTLLNKIKDEGVLKTWSARMSGNLHDPSIVVESGPVWRTRIGFEGANARVDVDGDGDATRLPAGVKDAILNELQGMDSSDPRYKGLMDMLFQDRLEKDSVDEQHNRPSPLPGPGNTADPNGAQPTAMIPPTIRRMSRDELTCLLEAEIAKLQDEHRDEVSNRLARDAENVPIKRS